RAGAHARRIRLSDAENVLERLWTDAAAGRGGTGNAVARSHVRIGAVIDVEQGALRALEQQLLLRTLRLEQQAGHILYHRTNRIGDREQLVERALEIHGLGAEVLPQYEIVKVEHFAELRRDALAMK